LEDELGHEKVNTAVYEPAEAVKAFFEFENNPWTVWRRKFLGDEKKGKKIRLISM
jgi:hypothetical protein